MGFEIKYDQYTFHITVTDYYKGCPAKTYGPPESCYEGEPEEIQWQCTAVEESLEDGSVVEITVDIDQYSDYIESQLLEMIHDAKDEDFDYPEPDYYPDEY